MVLAFLRAEIKSSRFAGDLLALLAGRASSTGSPTSPGPGRLSLRLSWQTVPGPRRGRRCSSRTLAAPEVGLRVAHVGPVDERAVKPPSATSTGTTGSRSLGEPASLPTQSRACGSSGTPPGDEVREIADALARGSMPLEIVVVGLPPGQELVVLEGHVRLTGLLLRPEQLPPEVRVLLGTSPRIGEWGCYGSL
jgi:hypothetical protein